MVKIDYNNIKSGRTVGSKNINIIDNRIYVEKDGLNHSDVEENRKKYGENRLTKKKRLSFAKQLLTNLNDPIIKILIGALIINAIVSLGRINIPETIGIGMAIVISTLVSTISEYSSSLAFEKLSDSNDNSLYAVKRNSEVCSIPAKEIVTGDIILLSSGEKIPCDGYLISGEINCDQASLTGENKEIRKTPTNIVHFQPNLFEFDLDNKEKVFSGSLICSGQGEMIAACVGDSTLIGKLADEVQGDNRPSPLKKRLSDLAGNISYLGYILAIMIAFACLFNAFFIDSGMDIDIVISKFHDKQFLLKELLHAVTMSVSVIVVAVPEGLPMMITVVLSSNMKKMLRDGVLVRRLVGIETAGNMSILFTDKTGTLTTGKMTVEKLITIDNTYCSYKHLSENKFLRDKFSTVCDAVCGTGKVSSTENAVLKFFHYEKKRNDNIQRIPFNSKTKVSKGIVSGKTYCMGAPEKLLKGVKYYIDSNGELIDVSAEEMRILYGILDSAASEGGRVLCTVEEVLNGSYVFLFYVIIKDPLRCDIKETVKRAQGAGIQVVMVTGDNLLTASKVAENAGILKNECNIVITSNELKSMEDEEVKNILPKVAVVARALPEDKIRLVKLAEDMGLVVGMTGDGVNDSPALKAADIGFAMGSGTDIAKESSDIVITDNSFKSIINAVLYGRTIFESIRKFIVFQLTMNLCAMGVSLIGPFIGIDNPVTIIQMLWVNIIMDTLGGLAFAGEPALLCYLKRKSISLDEKILNGKMIMKIILNGGYSLALCIFFLKSDLIKVFFYGKSQTYFLTAFFALLIFCGIFNSFNSRTDEVNPFSHIAGNKAFIVIMTAVAIMQLAIIYFGGSIFRCIPLDFTALLLSSLMALTVIPFDIVRKKITGTSR